MARIASILEANKWKCWQRIPFTFKVCDFSTAGLSLFISLHLIRLDMGSIFLDKNCFNTDGDACKYDRKPFIVT